jgi:hypothetical protein
VTPPPRVAAVRVRLASIVPIRVVLGLALLGLSLTGNAKGRSVGLAFAVGVLGLAVAVLADRRRLLLGEDDEPSPLPDVVAFEPPWKVALAATLPSTVGVAALAVVARIAGNEVLCALLAGGLGGMGLASGLGLVRLLAWEHEHGARLYAAPGRGLYAG